MLMRLTTLLSVGIFATLSIAGRELDMPADIDVTRAAASDPGLETGLISAANAATGPTAPTAPAGPADAALTPREAVEIAIAAGGASETVADLVPEEAVDAAIADAVEPAPAPQMWVVTGRVVNLRSGPGISNGVVDQVTLGDRAEVLSDPAESWVKIRTESGREAYIYGKFLTRETL